MNLSVEVLRQYFIECSQVSFNMEQTRWKMKNHTKINVSISIYFVDISISICIVSYLLQFKYRDFCSDPAISFLQYFFQNRPVFFLQQTICSQLTFTSSKLVLLSLTFNIFTLFSNIFIVDFKQVNVSWVGNNDIFHQIFICFFSKIDFRNHCVDRRLERVTIKE